MCCAKIRVSTVGVFVQNRKNGCRVWKFWSARYYMQLRNVGGDLIPFGKGCFRWWTSWELLSFGHHVVGICDKNMLTFGKISRDNFHAVWNLKWYYYYYYKILKWKIIEYLVRLSYSSDNAIYVPILNLILHFAFIYIFCFEEKLLFILYY